MAVPAMRIPVALDLDSLKTQTDKVSSQTGTALRVIAQQFVTHNREILILGNAAAQAYGGGWIGIATKIQAAFGAAKIAVAGGAIIMGAAIAEARRQLEEMVEIANKASERGVSAEFFQSFVRDAQKLRVEAPLLEEALTHAFQATKEQLDQISPALAKLQEFFLAGIAQDKSPLDLFRGAQNQSEQVYALVVAVDELRRSGEDLAALDLAETAFGRGFADKMRLGKVNIAEFRLELERLKREGVRTGQIFSDDIVKQAEEVDRKLKLANETLVRNLRPAFDGIADVALTIKSVWADIVGLLGQAAGILNSFSRASAVRQLEEERSNLERRLSADEPVGLLRAPLSQTAQGRMERARLEAINRELARFDAERYASDFQGQYPAAPGVPLPRSRPSGAPAPSFSSPTRDRFDSAVDSITRRTAALEAETQNIDKNTQAREAARVAAELQTVAVQANTAAGKEDTAVTAEQQAVIDQVAAAYGRAAQAAEDARSPLREFVRESANVKRMLEEAAVSGLRAFEDSLISLIDGTRSAKEAFRDMANAIIADLARIAIRQAITAPLAGFFGIPLPGRAAGGPVSGGSPYIVGEKGPEIFVPERSGTIVPNQVARSMGGSGTNFTYAPSYHFDAGIGPADMALIQSQIVLSEQRTRQDVTSIVRGDLYRDKDALGI